MQVVECYLPLIRFLARACNDEGWEYVTFRQQIDRYITQASQASAQIVDDDDMHAARFAMTVWVDEWVLRSGLALRHEWRDRLLQADYYRTVVGGETFFVRLDALDERNTQVRMVYLTCLLLGFQGKYRHLDHKQLQARIQSARRALPRPWWPEESPAEITPAYRDGNYRTPRRVLERRYLLPVALTATWAFVSIGLVFTFS